MATTKKIKDKSVSTAVEPDTAICLPDRDAKVAELAYYKAESRGFVPGYELNDWLEAEQEFSL